MMLMAGMVYKCGNRLKRSCIGRSMISDKDKDVEGKQQRHTQYPDNA